MFFLQWLVHKFETISRSGFVKALIVFLAAILLGLVYDLRNFKSFSTPEAMDSAQLARNISEGRGFTTQFIRPFALFLLNRGGTTNLATVVPDVSNPPVYPCVLAGLMKAVKFDFTIPSGARKMKSFWGNMNDFRRFQPDFLIALFNQALFLVLLAMTFLWARKMFDSVVAWASVVLLLGTEMLWRFTASGLPNIFLMLIFMTVVWCLTLFEQEAREPRFGKYGAMILAAAAGLFVGIGALTHYSFGCLIVPVLGFIIFSSGARAVNFCLVAVVYFALVLTPWIVRNYHLTGTAFGTAGYSPLEDTILFPDYQLPRSLDPNLRTIPQLLWIKLFTNLHAIREKLLGTGWVLPLFVTSLLIGFKNSGLRRIRYFVLSSFILFTFVEALARTHLATDSPVFNSENLLILLLPITMVYTVSFFWLLLERLQLPLLEMRILGAAFALVASLPMVLAVFKGEPTTISFPPYHPVVIQQFASWMKPDELMMSDMPWAVAWYGNRSCVWLTRDAVPAPENPNDPENVLNLAETYKPVNALFLTPLTLDAKLVSEDIEQRDNSWGKFALRVLVKQDVPDNFPLHQMPTGFLPAHLFLSDSKRWQQNVVTPDLTSPIEPSLAPERPGASPQNPLQRPRKRFH